MIKNKRNQQINDIFGFFFHLTVAYKMKMKSNFEVSKVKLKRKEKIAWLYTLYDKKQKDKKMKFMAHSYPKNYINEFF
jgi:hypothetical protein